MSASDELEARRAHACRLTPDRALATLDEAEAWARERGLVVRTPDCALPSLHAAVHEEPYAPDKPGFGQYPKTTWWWGWALAERPGLRWLRIRRGKAVLVTDAVAALVDPLARVELERVDAGELGDSARRLAAHLAAAGPSFVEDVKVELALDGKALRAVRARVEPAAAVVAREVPVAAAGGGARYATELARWDQRFPEPAAGGGAAELLAVGVEAAVVAPEREARRWFTWPVGADEVDRLVAEGRLGRTGAQLYALRRP
jgi:hypothetical protein